MRRALVFCLAAAAAAAQTPDGLTREILRRKTVEGALRRAPDGSYLFRIKDLPQVSLPVQGAWGIDEAMIGLPITAPVVAVNGKPHVAAPGMELTSVAAFNRLSGKLSTTARTALKPAIQELSAAAADALVKPMRLVALLSLSSMMRLETAGGDLPARAAAPRATPAARIDRSNQLSQQALIDLYGKAATDVERHALLEVYAGSREASKARYGRYELYRPLGYGRVMSNSRGGVALVEGAQPFCSGVLISSDLVLTARHCIANRFANGMSVWFDYEQDLLGRSLAVDEYPVEGIAAQGAVMANGTLLDFALLRISAKAGVKPGDSHPPQCLSVERLNFEAALYVVGHPQGAQRLVHDHGWINFPFQVNRRQLTALEMNVELEHKDAPDRAARVDEFRRSYVKRQDALLGEVWENFSQRWDGQPTIGAEIDTFHGNSGGPAYDRNLHRVVGLLFAGEPDVAAPWKAGWSRHEAILPISLALDQIQEQRPGWQQAEGVCVYRSAAEFTSSSPRDLCAKRCAQ